MTAISNLTLSALTLMQIKGVGPATLRQLLPIASHANATLDDMIAASPKLQTKIGKDHALLSSAHSAARQQEELAHKAGVRIIAMWDLEYPALLKETKDAPFILYVKGTPLNDKAYAQPVAVIGTRHPTSHGEIIGKRITRYLCEQGCSIISGLAIGCDTIAHETAVELGAATVGVMAHGLHTLTPKKNAWLAEKMLEMGGTLVSEYGFGIDPKPPFFVKRDRIQAGLSKGVIMVQSDVTGGSLHASRAALDYGRWLAVPRPTLQDRNGEEKVGANMVLSFSTLEEKMALLKCSEQALKKLLILESREDYPKLIEAIKESGEQTPEATDQLF